MCRLAIPKRWPSAVTRWSLVRLLCLVGTVAQAQSLEAREAERRAGEAIVVAHAGRVNARYPVGPVHRGQSAEQDLFTGVSVGEGSRITTGRNGHLCLVLSPGALLHVPPNTHLTLTRLRHTAQGLPRSESDLVRRIEVHLERGGVHIDGGMPTPSLDIRVVTEGGDVRAAGSVFSVVRTDDDVWSVWCEAHEVDLIPRDEEAGQRIAARHSGLLTPSRVETDAAHFDPRRHAFRLCRGFFRDLETFRHPLRGFDRQGVAHYVGLADVPAFVGDPGFVADVSPSVRSPAAQPSLPVTPAAIGAPDGRRWEEDRIRSWWSDVGVVRGVNYIPRTCVNSTELWMEDTFDTTVIDEELGWASSIGYTTVRVPLQFAVWAEDAEGFLDRMETFLRLAAGHGLTVVPVLFDDLNTAGSDPYVGPQPEPEPGRHNPAWTPSPGPSRVTDPEQWPELEKFVRAVVNRFKRDKRVLYWDLYNTAGHDNLWEQSLPLLDQAFNWVRDVNPRQPLAVAAWKDLESPMAARKLERSDIITFQTFDSPDIVEATVQLLARHNRPIIAADWLMRQQDNTFHEILPVFAKHGVGWFNRGLVQGRSQAWIQDDAFRVADAPDLWQHDVLKSDGTPYDEREVELIRGFRYVGGR